MVSQQCARDIYNNHIQQLRHSEFPSLSGTTYLDHAGTTLYPSSLIDAFHEDLKNNLYGNPHSECPASDLSTQTVDDARLSVLKYFNADPDHFDVVFTANATAAIKLVADCFRDQSFWYGFHKDAHSSIVGVREVASLGSRCFVSNEDVEDWMTTRHTSMHQPELTLFAYPAQSNMTGYRPPYSWARRMRDLDSRSLGHQPRTFVLLDAASYLTTGRLDLSIHEDAPDFIALSFYKIFGFPDLGALIVRKSAHDVLTRRRYFGGGTVDQVTVVDAAFHAKKTHTIHDFLEDGTLPFHNIVALSHAIRIHDNLFGSAQAISNHVSQLSSTLYEGLTSLKHLNHKPVLRIHKDPLGVYGDPTTQGPIFAFSVCRSDGSFIGKSHFERLAIDCGFQIRTGGVCNPGGIATMLHLNHWELRRNFTEGARCGGDIDIVGGKPTGIIRVSLGAMSTMADIDRFVAFVEWFFVENRPSEQRPQVVDEGTTSGTVAPLEFCSAIDLAYSENPDAYRIWNGQWCIVEPSSGRWRPWQSRDALSHLRCNINARQGELHISRHGRADLVVSLWDRPQQDTMSTLALDPQVFDIYADPTIAEWLSEALGSMCTLARYRGRDVEDIVESRTCMISTCDIQFATRPDLHQHYKIHAAAFLIAHPFRIPRKISARDSAHKHAAHLGGKHSWLKSQSTIVESETADSASSWSSKAIKEKTSGIDDDSKGKNKSRSKWQRLRAKVEKILLNCGSTRSIDGKA